MQIGSMTGDDLAMSMLDAIVDKLQNDTSRTIMTTEWEAVYPRFPWQSDCFQMPRPPLNSITSIQYRDADFNLQTFDSSNYRAVLSDQGQGLIALADGSEWPDTYWGAPDAVTVTLLAGYATDTADVPAHIQQISRLWFTHMWDQGRDAVVNVPVNEMPYALRYCTNQLYWGDYPR
jgi:uncharacterized phiE125 gp8 family phage protein